MVSEHVSIVVAFVAGVVSFLSPCVLPLIPGYVSLVSGLSLEQLTSADASRQKAKSVLRGALLFVAGFSLVFTLLGAFAAGLTSPLSAYLPLLRKVAGAVVVLFGLHTAGILPIRWLYVQKAVFFERLPWGTVVGPVIVGMAFAFGWTPCVGPILGSLLALAATGNGVGSGAALLLVYSLGIGVPFLITGVAVGRFMRLLKRHHRLLRWVEIGAGLMLVVVGALIFTNRLSALAAPLPWFNRFVL